MVYQTLALMQIILEVIGQHLDEANEVTSEF